MRSNHSQAAVAALLLVTAIWGSTFFLIKDAVGQIDPIDFLAVRFIIAAALPAVLFRRRLARLRARDWVLGLSVGVIYGAGQIAQTIGLKYTAASVSGFITGTYVVITPIILWLWYRRRPLASTWLAVSFAMLGLAILSLRGGLGLGFGESLTLFGAALYACHIVALDTVAKRLDAMALSVLQLIAVAGVCLVAALPNGVSMPPSTQVWGAVLYTAIVAGVVTMSLQTWAQKHLRPAVAALLMTFEPIFAAAFAVALGGEVVTPRLLIGGLFIVIATVIGTRGERSTPASLQKPRVKGGHYAAHT